MYCIWRATNNDSPLETEIASTRSLTRDTIRSRRGSQIEAAGFVLELTAAKALEADDLAKRTPSAGSSSTCSHNALKFLCTAERKVVVIGYRLANAGGSEAGEVVFFVRDYGPGIDRDQRKKLFLTVPSGRERTDAHDAGRRDRSRAGEGVGRQDECPGRSAGKQEPGRSLPALLRVDAGANAPVLGAEPPQTHRCPPTLSASAPAWIASHRQISAPLVRRNISR